MTNNSRRLPWFGAALIVVGLLMLLNRLDVLEIHFFSVVLPILMVFGVVVVARGFSQNAAGKVFWGTVLFLYSLFFFLRSIDSLNLHGPLVVPSTFIILGLAFAMLFLNNVREWFFLLPAVFLTGIGVVFILVEYDYLYGWEAWSVLGRYWPVLLILVGVAVILRRKEHRTPAPPPQA